MKKSNQSQVRGIRVDEQKLDDIMNHAANMGLSFSDVIQQCVELGMPVLKRTEYYRARLAGVPVAEVAELVAGALDKLAEKRGG